ncbi:MAG TPA: peptidylprolyl isomerase [Bryobacteraceae bacterium]|jgi:peptidyl-prolyl cis-trans isomerase A (cyclophilin A)|nr:peptidylprolyl isomerase [Bryobacteraceae bacterium]
MSSRSEIAILTGLACLLLLGCSSEKPAPAPVKKAAAPEPTPEVVQVKFETSKGDFVVEATRAWAPRGVDHFYELVKTGYYDGNRFYRVLPRYVVQFGVNGDPQTSRLWSSMSIPDDPVKESNKKGTVTYARRGPASRTTQIFVNMRDNKDLDGQGFAPFGRVISGMDVIGSLYSGYGEMAPRGQGPDPTQIELQGNSYVENHFPRLDYIRRTTILR